MAQTHSAGAVFKSPRQSHILEEEKRGFACGISFKVGWTQKCSFVIIQIKVIVFLFHITCDLGFI